MIVLQQGSECTFRFEQSVDVAIKTSMSIKNVQDAKKYSAYKKYAHTWQTDDTKYWHCKLVYLG